MLGEQNHNPCNLEDFGIQWQGLVGRNGPYCVFDTDEDGIRAGARDLHTKVVLHGLNTLSRLVPVFAPRRENNVPAYIADLVQWTKWGPNDPINADDPATLQLLTTGVIHHEQGRVIYPQELVAQAVADALASNAIKHLTPLIGERH